MRIIRIFLFLSALSLCAAACSKADTEQEKTRLYVNTFARDYMKSWYLWNKEIGKDLDAWENTEEPVAKVAKIRYKDAKGDDIDRWTMVTDDFDSFYGSVSGNRKTYGFGFVLYYTDDTRTSLCAVVTFTYAGSPAEKAGLKRGDAIFKVNGRTIPAKDYSRIVSELMGGDRLTAELYDGRTVTLEAREMYEDPVLLDKVFEFDGKRVGYLVYTSFTLDSYRELTDACARFKEAGVKELILDLRYNGGGYVVTENVLASLLAPEAEVLAGSVFEKEVYNAALTRELGSGLNKFKTEFYFTSDGEDYEFSTKGANIGLSRIYAIIDSGTASAAESILTGLLPYMDIVLIGGQSHGKYCGGIMYSAKDWYKDNRKYMDEDVYETGIEQAGTWGIYVIYERYADKNGVTPCMPDGFVPDIPVDDNPQEARDLGDPKETMLAVALAQAGYVESAPLSAEAPKAALPGAVRVADAPKKAAFGVRLELPE